MARSIGESPKSEGASSDGRRLDGMPEGRSGHSVGAPIGSNQRYPGFHGTGA
jgi:hypothetical protein